MTTHLVDIFPAYGKPGHHVFACACGEVGTAQPDIEIACNEAQGHLDEVAADLVWT